MNPSPRRELGGAPRPPDPPILSAFRLTLPAVHEETATTLFWEHQTTGIEVQPGEDGQVVLLAYFYECYGLEARLREALRSLPRWSLERAPVTEVDWVSRFREGFRPFRAGGFLIAPHWEVPAPRPRAEPLLIVDPGRAFGTGTHETTRLCLSALAEMAEERGLGRVLDLGTGTGILAVASALRGARSATGVDIDPEAIDSARHHARLNGVEVRLVLGDGGRPFAPASFDLVLANLTAALLRERRDEIPRLCAPGAAAVLAGFLTEDAAAIREAYRGLGPATLRTDGEWAAFVIPRVLQP